VKLDEFAFFNQQLAGMLKSGIPLESALRQLSQAMGRGRFRTELELLGADLSKGKPLEQALAGRKLPDFYKEMIRVGVKSNDLPAILTLLADYYQRLNFLWTRLRTLLIYPLIVLVFCFALSVFLVAVAGSLSANLGLALGQPMYYPGEQPGALAYGAALLAPVLILGLMVAGVFAVLAVPKWRRNARWVLPGFKEAHLSRLAASLSLMLKSGCDLKTALAPLQSMEEGTKMGAELSRWEGVLAQGATKFTDLGAVSKVVPPLFFCLVGGQGENLPAGLAQAGEMYYGRAVYKSELFLQTVLPVSILLLGIIIIAQLQGLAHLMFGGGFFMLRDLLWHD
jgi:type II secretory pathway component PulF